MSYSIKTGVKTFEIAVDDIENGVIKLKFNPSDSNMLLKYERFNADLEKKLDELPDDDLNVDENSSLPEVTKKIESINKLIYSSYDTIFGDGFSKEAFKYCSPMTLSNGVPFAVSIGKVIAQIIKDNAKKEQPKFEKYMKKYQR